jgi:hypothetical protein
MTKVKMNKWKLGGLLIELVSFLLLTMQQFIGFFEFADVIASRTFVILCTLGISIGSALLLGDSGKKVLKWFVLIASILFGFIFIGGFSCSLADVLGYDFGIDATSSYFILDAMSDTIANTGIIINMITKSIVPCVVVIVGIVMFLLASGPDEYTTALIECGVCVGMLAVFGLLQKYLF